MLNYIKKRSLFVEPSHHLITCGYELPLSNNNLFVDSNECHAMLSWQLTLVYCVIELRSPRKNISQILNHLNGLDYLAFSQGLDYDK